MTLSEAFELYRQDVIIFRNQSAKTEEHHIITLNSLIRFIGRDIRIEKLTFEMVRDWKIGMDKQNRSVATIRGYLFKLRVVLAYLKANGHKVLDPSLIQPPKRDNKLPLVVTPEDVTKLIASAHKLRNKAIISLLYSSGMRVSELCSLNRSDLKRDYFTVHGKGKKNRLCFVDARSRDLLDQYLSRRTDNNPALFTGKFDSHRITPGNVQDIFKYTRQRAGFEFPVHPHTMRHSFATNLMINGCHIYTLSKLLGHSSIETTAIYLHLYDSDLETAFRNYHSV